MAVFAGAVFAQQGTTNIKPLTSFALPKPAVYDTRLQVPQIAPLQSTRDKTSENELVPNLIKKDLPNNMPVGGMLADQRGSKSKLQFFGPGFTNGWPPDCDFAVGPNHVICVVNEAMAVFDKKTGKKVFQTNLTGNQFFSGIGVVGEVISDPKIQYDKASGHWFVHIIEVDGLSSGTKASYQLIGVSETNDPNGKWKKYRINSLITVNSNQLWLDYPGVGVSEDGFVFTGNMFGFTSGFTGGIFAMSKSALINGTPGQVTVFTDDQTSTIEPARSYVAGSSTIYMMSTYSTSSVKVFAVSNFTGTPKLVSSVVSVPSFTPPTRNAVGPGGHQMDGFDPRMFTAVLRNGSIYGAHNAMSPSGSVLACRWYEVGLNNWPNGTSNPKLVQSGNIFDGGGVFDSHMPAINANKYGNISVLYTRSSPTVEASLVYSAHKKSDANGSMGLPVLLGSSPANSGAQPGARWGDYFNVSIDPTDDSTFWGFGELCVAGGLWTTQVNTWTVADPSLSVAFAPVAANPFDGKLASGNYTALAVKDGRSMSVNSSAVKGSGQIASIEATYNTSLKSGTTDLLTVTATASLPVASTQQFYVYDWVAKAYKYIGAVSASTSAEFTLGDSAAKTTNFIKSDGTVKILYRVINPVRNGILPPPMLLPLDFLLLKGLPA